MSTKRQRTDGPVLGHTAPSLGELGHTSPNLDRICFTDLPRDIVTNIIAADVSLLETVPIVCHALRALSMADRRLTPQLKIRHLLRREGTITWTRFPCGTRHGPVSIFLREGDGHSERHIRFRYHFGRLTGQWVSTVKYAPGNGQITSGMVGRACALPDNVVVTRHYSRTGRVHTVSVSDSLMVWSDPHGATNIVAHPASPTVADDIRAHDYLRGCAIAHAIPNDITARNIITIEGGNEIAFWMVKDRRRA